MNTHLIERDSAQLGHPIGSQGNILFLHTIVGRGGDAVQVQCMLDGLSRLGFGLSVVAGRKLQPYAVSTTGTVVSWVKRLPWWALDVLEVVLNLIVMIRAWVLSRRTRPDLVFERSSPYGVAGLIVSKILHRPLVVHLDAPFLVEREFRGRSMFRRLHRLVMRIVGRHAAVIVVGTEASRVHYAQMGLPTDRMLLLQNGVFAEDVVQEIPRRSEPPVIGFIGSMARWHRVDLLLDAVARLHADGVPAQLHLVGSGEEYSRLVNQAADLHLNQLVHFHGPMGRSQTIAVLDRCDIAVLPHTLTTGAPMKLFEYAARGTAIVAPDLPNLRQIWGDTAIAYFSPGNLVALVGALHALISDPAKRRQLAEEARARVIEEYLWEPQLAAIVRAASPTTIG